ncbi:MAG: 50S ribosomal protein L10 [Chitinophagales bacterium]|nr:50S ribosomal protein L10 [Chitinophagales bacterium]MDW8419704.1 50S ribosomal protein L10 [Chitinophagales bacterium]
MDKNRKNQEIAELKQKFSNSSYFYFTDSSTMTVEKTNKFRRLCFNAGVEYRVSKNTLIKKALEQTGRNFEALYPLLKGFTGIIFSADGATPAKILKEFRQESDRPILKGAYIDSEVYVGDNQISVLSQLKSKKELLGDVIGLLQSPARNVISALQGSSSQKIAGLVKALEERGK